MCSIGFDQMVPVQWTRWPDLGPRLQARINALFLSNEGPGVLLADVLDYVCFGADFFASANRYAKARNASERQKVIDTGWANFCEEVSMGTGEEIDPESEINPFLSKR